MQGKVFGDSVNFLDYGQNLGPPRQPILDHRTMGHYPSTPHPPGLLPALGKFPPAPEASLSPSGRWAQARSLWRVSVLHQGRRRGRNGWKEEQARSPGLRIIYTPAHSRPSCQHTTAPCSSSGYRKAGCGPWGLTDRGEDNVEVDDTSTGAGCVVSEEAGAERETHSGRGQRMPDGN